eukprot:m.205698 g.205698  ORF g.205698 m.205698 type:complete len:51 (-) comp22024_c0_seq2:25-177(-)
MCHSPLSKLSWTAVAIDYIIVSLGVMGSATGMLDSLQRIVSGGDGAGIHG